MIEPARASARAFMRHSVSQHLHKTLCALGVICACSANHFAPFHAHLQLKSALHWVFCLVLHVFIPAFGPWRANPLHWWIHLVRTSFTGMEFVMCTHRQGSQTLLFVCRHKLCITG